MKLSFSLFFAGWFLALGTSSAQSNPKDSIIISFNENTRVVIYGAERKGLEQIRRYDFNRMIRDLLVRLDSLPQSGGINYDSVPGGDYLRKDTVKEKDTENPGEKKERPVDRPEQRHAPEGKYAGGTELHEDSLMAERDIRYSAVSPRNGLDLKFGLNTYANKVSNNYESAVYKLRPGASRFFSLGAVKSVPLVRGRHTGFFLDLGVNVAWNNLMFEENKVLYKDNDRVRFGSMTDREGRNVNLKKSKLVATYLDFSVMPTVAFSGSVITHVSSGFYAGHRIGTYRKTRTRDGEKERISGDFFLEDLHYGVAFELGIRDFPDFFVNYDLNPLFLTGRGPELRMLSFGLKM